MFDGSAPDADARQPGILARGLLAALAAYKVLLSPLFAGSCRYLPSCSDYMAEAVRRHGAARGFWLGVKRLGRCQPLGPSGYDPVPLAIRAASHNKDHGRCRGGCGVEAR